MIFENYERFMLALGIWREARGESADAKIGVGCVLRNRVKIAPAQGFKADIVANIIKPYAFSSFNAGDPNAVKFPAPADPAWRESCEAAEKVLAGCEDPTGGAVFYFSPPVTEPPRAWGPVEHSSSIGNLRFYRIAA